MAPKAAGAIMHRRRTMWIMVAALVLLAIVVVVAIDQARGDDPADIRIPAPRQGDVASYSVSIQRIDDRGAAVPYIVDRVEAAWDAPDRLRLRADYSFWNVEPAYESSIFQEVHYDAADASPHVTVFENFPELVAADNGISLPGVDINQGNTAWADSWFRVSWFRDAAAPCGFRPAFVDDRASIQSAITVGGHCGRHGEAELFRYRGIEEVGGLDTLRFDAVTDPDVSVWYNPVLPFPVQVQEHFTGLFDRAKTNGHVFRWTLDGFSGGEGDAHTTPLRMAPAPVATVPYDGRVPDETGVDHPFPMSQAWDFLVEQDEEFASFLQRHPDAYAAEAVHRFSEDELGRGEWRWQFVVTEGTHHVARSVWYRPGLPTGWVDMDPRPVGLSVTSGPIDAGLPGNVSRIYPPPALVPTRQPALAETMARVTQSYGEQANWWAVRTMCTEGDCGRLRLWFDVGVQRSWHNDEAVPTIAGVIEPPPASSRMLRFHPDGTAVLASESSLAPAWASVIGDRPGWDPSTTPAVAGSFAAPPAATIVSVGIVAAVLGVLAVAWNPVKASLIAGFSRVTKARALDNATRGRIHDTIVADPGVHFQELLRRTGTGRGALDHHLRKLTDTGLVEMNAAGGYTSYYPAGSTDRRIMAARGVLKAQAARRIFSHLTHHGPAKPRAIADALGISPGTVSHHLRRLREAGVVEGGARQPYRPAPHAGKLVAGVSSAAG